MREARKVKSKNTIPLLCAALLMTTACSDQSDDLTGGYTIPENFCGAEIDPREFEPILPPGEELTTEGEVREMSDSLTSSMHHCTVFVDGKRAFSLDSSPTDQIESVSGYVSEKGLILDIDNPEFTRSGEHEITTWPSLAIGFSRCAESQFNDSGIGFALEASETLGINDAALLAESLASYMEGRIAQIDSQSCTFS